MTSALAALLVLLVSAVAIAAGSGLTKVKGTFELSRVVCSSSQSCVSVGQSLRIVHGGNSYGGVVVPISDGAPGKVHPVANVENLDALVCPRAESCLALGENQTQSAGLLLPISHGQPGTPTSVPNAYLYGIACVTATSCWVTAEHATAGQAPSAAELVQVVSGVVKKVFKLSGKIDFAVGEGGSAAPYCAPSGVCIAVGTTGFPNRTGLVVTFQNGHVISTHKVSGATILTGLACASLRSCVVAGDRKGTSSSNGVILALKNGKPGPVHPVPGANYLGPVGCRSASSCDAFGSETHGTGKHETFSGAEVVIEHGTPGKPESIVPSIQGAWCNVGGCVAVGLVGGYPNGEGAVLRTS